MRIMDFSYMINIIVKYGTLITLLVYVVFAVLIIRQINLMLRTFFTPHEKNIKLLGWVHLGIAVLILLLAIVL